MIAPPSNIPTDESRVDLLSNMFAIVGLIIVVTIVVWGIVHFARLSSGWMPSFFSTSSSTVAIAPLTAATTLLATPIATSTTPKPVTKPIEKPKAPAGPADLSVAITRVGVIDSGSGMFVDRYPTSPYDMAAVEFEIANIGKSASGTYTFEAFLPTQSNYLYTSPVQTSLAPGDHITNTLRFTQTISGAFTVVVDPTHATKDSDTGNNIASINISLPYPQPYSY